MRRAGINREDIPGVSRKRRYRSRARSDVHGVGNEECTSFGGRRRNLEECEAIVPRLSTRRCTSGRAEVRARRESAFIKSGPEGEADSAHGVRSRVRRYLSQTEEEGSKRTAPAGHRREDKAPSDTGAIRRHLLSSSTEAPRRDEGPTRRSGANGDPPYANANLGRT